MIYEKTALREAIDCIHGILSYHEQNYLLHKGQPEGFIQDVYDFESQIDNKLGDIFSQGMQSGML